METPIGTLGLLHNSQQQLLASGFNLTAQKFTRTLGVNPGVTLDWASTCPLHIKDAFERYFSGELQALKSVASTSNGTPFQERVWSALRSIPPGETRSYQQIAEQIGHPKAIRAVGMANHYNPLGVLVPCHRVIGKNGKLTGYASGMQRKSWLLAHEARHRQDAAQQQLAL